MASDDKQITVQADDPHISAALPAVIVLFLSMVVLAIVLAVAWQFA